MALATEPDTGMEPGQTCQQIKNSDQETRETNGEPMTTESVLELPNDESPKEERKVNENRRKSSERKILLELGPADNNDVPLVTLEQATPSPHSPSRMADVNNNEEDQDDDDFEEEGEEEEAEEEEVDTEMMPEEKQAMFEAVKSGDIDALEDCLDKPNSDINMSWFRENLLMAAIRHGQQEMAEFLLDNGVDHTYKTSMVAMRETSEGKILDRYELTCRQMAYDFGQLDIVELIDLFQGKLFPFIRPPERTPRYRRPKPPTPPESESDDGSSDSSSDSSDSSVSGEGSESDSEGSGSPSVKRRSRRRKKKKILKRSETDMEQSLHKTEEDLTLTDGIFDFETEQKTEVKTERKKDKIKKSKRKKKNKRKETLGEVLDGEGEMNRTAAGSGLDIDSGHHSMGSSKLKVAMLREHDRLAEQNEYAAESAEGGLCPPNQTIEEKSYKDALRSDKSEAEGSHGPDEGYATISAKSSTPCVSPEMKPSWALPPTNLIRSTKSALAVKRIHGYTNTYMGFSDIEENVHDSPLRWRKVSTAGSYAKESRQWHVDTSASLKTTVEISEIKFTPPSTAQSSTVPTSVLSSSLPKSILKPNTPSSTSTLSEVFPTAESSVGKQRPKATVNPGHAVASYMRPTKSTLTKKKLSSDFVTSYGALDFQYLPETKASKYFVHSSMSTSDFRSRTPSSKSSPLLTMPYLSSTNLHKRNSSGISFRS